MAGNTTLDQMKAYTARQSTEILFQSLDVLEALDNPTADHRLTKAVISDEIEARFNLGDAMDEIYMDDNYRGTYTDALRQAMAKVHPKV